MTKLLSSPKRPPWTWGPTNLLFNGLLGLFLWG